MVSYKVEIENPYEVLADTKVDAPDEVAEFISEQLHEHGEGEYTINVSAFEEE